MPDNLLKLERYLTNSPGKVSAVVDFDRAVDKLYPFDFTASNQELNSALLEDTEQFSKWISHKLKAENCRYGIGGYNEHRAIYSRSNLFDAGDEPRRLHLGTDIWGHAETAIYCPLDAIVHSFHFNDNFGDYGATIILQHNLEGSLLYTLYGHLSLASIAGLTKGERIQQGEQFAEFGDPLENGHWPPHLHFQIMFNMKSYSGDYPGVCAFSEKDTWLQNSPNPNLLLRYTF